MGRLGGQYPIETRSVIPLTDNAQFFIELWDQLQARAKSTNVNDNLVGSMSYREVKDATSTAVGSDSEGSVFDMTIDGYRRLQRRAEEFMAEALKSDLSNAFKHYLTRTQWTTVGDVPSDLAVTAELDQPLRVSRDYLAFLKKTLSKSHGRHLLRNVIIHVQELIWSELLMKQDFTALGAAQLERDLIEMELLQFPPNTKLRQGVLLLSLPLSAQEVKEGQDIPTLKEASNAMFATNAKADELLKRMRLPDVSRTEARAILARRVEAME